MVKFSSSLECRNSDVEEKSLDVGAQNITHEALSLIDGEIFIIDEVVVGVSEANSGAAARWDGGVGAVFLIG
jgi:hypothetical protein